MVFRDAYAQCQVLMWASRGGAVSLTTVATQDEAKAWLRQRRLELSFNLAGSMSVLEKALYEMFLAQTKPDSLSSVLAARVLHVRPEA